MILIFHCFELFTYYAVRHNSMQHLWIESSHKMPAGS